jgi:hypothetical protein
MSLKAQNMSVLALIIAINTLFLCAMIGQHSITGQSIQGVLRDAKSFLPVGVGLVVTTVLNGLLSRATKERLVFLRWRNALPGHRAFSEHATNTPTVDIEKLREKCGGAFPFDPAQQNRVCYRLYKSVENDAAVRQVHGSFLLTRDYTGLSFLFFIFYGAIAIYSVQGWTLKLIYILLLALQYFLARMAAENYAVSFVRTVLTRASQTS